MSLKEALAGGGAFLTGAALLIGALGGEQIQPAEQFDDHLNPFASSPSGFSCPSGYETTQGVDPDTQTNFTTCDNGRIIVTKRDGANPVVFDTLTGKFLEEVP